MKIGEILKELQPCEYSKLQQKEIKKVCEDNCVRNVNWDNLEKCFSGRDKIPYKMMEKCKPLALYNYLRLLTTVRRIVRRQ